MRASSCQLMDKPDVDLIEGLSPAISIEQKAASHNRARRWAPSPRSTITCACLYARVGTPYCPDHGLPLAGAERQPDGGRGAGPGRPSTRLAVLAPVARGKKGSFEDEMRRACRPRAMCACAWTASWSKSTRMPPLKKTEKHDIDVVIDRLRIRAGKHAAPGGKLRDRAADWPTAAAMALDMDSEP